MNAEQYERICQLFEAARPFSPAERSAFLDRACPDASLRAAVERFLADDEAAQRESFLSTPLPVNLETVLSNVQADDGLAGQRLGAYELEREIARGGMGVVYQARQVELNRTVALKMIRDGALAGPEERTRFRVEAEAVARFQHPNIVQIYDVGEQHGLHYFAMEYVGGGSLADRLREAPLPASQAAALVETLARAMHHAHERGIIHRDLKPANILLGDRPSAIGHRPELAGAVEPNAESRWPSAVKITDFGLAKRLDVEPGQTRSGAIMGTPSYMAPEQAQGQGKAIGPAADIYALGVILYECLTGRPPFQAPTPLDTLLQVVADEPVPPRRLQPMVPRDLETISLKCLEKEPGKRYGSAAELADDLARFQRGEPVRARSIGRLARTGRWCKRNPVVAGLVATVAVVLLAGASVASVLAFVATEQAAEAERKAVAEEEARAKAVAALGEAEQARARTRQAIDDMTSRVTADWLITQKELLPEQERFLNLAIDYYREFASEAAEDEAGRHRAAAGNFQLGWLLDRLGKKAEAETAYRHALAIREKLAADFPDRRVYRQELAGNHNNLGALLTGLRKYTEAETAFLEALAIYEKLAVDYPAIPEYRKELAQSHGNLGIVQKRTGKREEAEAASRQALAIHEKLAADFPYVAQYREGLARSHNNLARMLVDWGERTEAEQMYRQGLALREQLTTDFPSSPQFRQGLAGIHRNLGELLSLRGKRAEAEQAFLRALAVSEKLAADFPSQPQYRHELAEVHSNFGIALKDMEKPIEAEAAYQRALVTYRKLSVDFPDRPEFREGLAQSNNHLGALLSVMGRHAEAEAAHQQALAIREKLAADAPTIPEHRQGLARTYNTLGSLLARLGKHAEAERAYRQALPICEKLATDFPNVPDYAVDLGGSQCNLGHAVRDGGKPEDALGWYDKAVATLAPVLQRQPHLAQARQFLHTTYRGRAQALDQIGRHPEALKDWDRAIELDDKRSPQPRMRRALSLARAGEHARAAAAAEEVAKFQGLPVLMLYPCACTFALASAVVQDDAALKEQYGARAVQLLKQGQASGLFKNKAMVDQLRKDADLNALRERADFQQLLKDLDKP